MCVPCCHFRLKSRYFVRYRKCENRIASNLPFQTGRSKKVKEIERSELGKHHWAGCYSCFLIRIIVLRLTSRNGTFKQVLYICLFNLFQNSNARAGWRSSAESWSGNATSSGARPEIPPLPSPAEAEIPRRGADRPRPRIFPRSAGVRPPNWSHWRSRIVILMTRRFMNK